MSHPTDQDRLAEALANLPRQLPADGFTDDVLAALDSRIQGPSRPPGRRLWIAAATLVLVAALALGYSNQRQRSAERAYRAQVEELRSRYQDLLDEVATVRNEVTTPDTRIYLGGDEKLDLVLDLSQIPNHQDDPQSLQDVRPASWKQ